MKIIVDRYTSPEFSIEINCSHCTSSLMLDSIDDIKCGSHMIFDSPGWADNEKHLEFQCPLCKESACLNKDVINKLPKSVIMRVYPPQQ